MTFALTDFKCRSLDYQCVTNKRGIQQVHLVITAAATDTALDIDTDAGTFWTAAKADATFGTLATAALTTLKTIITSSVGYMRMESDTITEAMLRVAAGSEGAGAYSMTVSHSRPNVVFGAANGITAANIWLYYELKNGIFPLVVN